MKRNMKKWVVLLLAFSVWGCLGENDDVLDYNPIEQLETDLAQIDSYLSQNNITAEIDEDTQIRYVITQEGDGVNPAAADVVSVEYEVYSFEGDLLDTSKEDVAEDGGIFNSERVYEPLQFQIGTNSVISGFQYATVLLDVGGKGDFYIPSVWAYQNIGSGNVAPNQSLIFKIELLEINPE